MNELTSTYPVHIGLWTDWSYGAVLGRTLTLSRSNGALLIAFLAFFVTLVGSQTWRILCFILHHYYSVPHPTDGLHNQRQAILRNSGSPLGGFWEFTQLTWAWRHQHKTRRSVCKIIPVLAFAALVACALALASGFSSRLALGNEVLIAGDNCGLPRWSNASTSEILRYLQPRFVREVERASDYAQRCYREDGSDSDCNTPVRRSLPISINYNASCPFNNSMCLSQDANILLDTGLIDSHSDLGINAPASSRFQYRQTFHCAPLVTDSYRNYFKDSKNRTFVRYQYGPAFFDKENNCNCTFALHNDTSKVLRKTHSEALVPGYLLSSISAFFVNGSLSQEYSQFKPAEAFGRTDADIHLISLAAPSTWFVDKSPDLWYRATQPDVIAATIQTFPSEEITIWRPEEPLWPMGCTVQQQYCGPLSSNEDFCTPLAGYHEVFESVLNRFTSDPGGGLKWTLNTLSNVLDVGGLLSALDTKALTSRFGMAGLNMQTMIEPNQWQLDVTHWFNTSLAWMQSSVLATAAGSRLEEEAILKLAIRPNDPEAKETCRNQKMRSPEYTSFNFFWLVFIVVLGCTIIVTSLVLETLVAWVQRRWSLGSYARMEWLANHKLYLQRLAHEELGFGEWQTGSLDIPVTKAGDTLGVLDISAPDAPRILPPDSLTLMEKGTSGETISGSSAGFAQETVSAHEDGPDTVSLVSAIADSNRPERSPIVEHYNGRVIGVEAPKSERSHRSEQERRLLE